jgi:excisionase family DNA binding protein
MREPIAAPRRDDAVLRRIDEELDEGTLTLTTSEGEHIKLPQALRDLLGQCVYELRRGNRVSLVPVGRSLTTQQAAEMLNVSRPYLIRLLEAGELPFEMVGTHRRLRIEDVLTYRKARSERRREVFRALNQQADELGIYAD